MSINNRTSKTGYIIGINALVIDCITLVDRFPNEGQAVRGSTQERYPGGKGANAIIAAHKVGVPAKFYTTVHPNDAAFLLKNLKEVGIDISGAMLSEKTDTVIANIAQNTKTGDHTVVTFNGRHEISAEMVAASDFAPNNTLMLQAKLSDDILYALINKAHLANCDITFNFCPVKKLDQEIFSKLKFIVVNEHEAYEIVHLYGIPHNGKDEDIAKNIAAFFKVTTIVTRGSKSIILARKDSSLITYPAIELDNVVSPIGAGDAFFGVLTALIHLGEDMEIAIKKAIVASAIVCTKYAPQSCPSLEEIEAFGYYSGFQK